MAFKFPPINELMLIVDEARKLLGQGGSSSHNDKCVYLTIYANENGLYDYSYSTRNPRYDGREKNSERYRGYKHSATLAFFGGDKDDVELVAEGLLYGLYRCKQEMDRERPEDEGWGHTEGGYYAIGSARAKQDELSELGIGPVGPRPLSNRPLDADDEFDYREENPIPLIIAGGELIAGAFGALGGRAALGAISSSAGRAALSTAARGAVATAGRGVNKVLGSKIGRQAVALGYDQAKDKVADKVKGYMNTKKGEIAVHKMNARGQTHAHIKTQNAPFFYR